jgi:small subunit ribosomal protein S20
MAHTKSSIKDLKQTKKRTERNKALKSRARTFVKKARASTETGKDDAQPRVKEALRELDKMVSKGVLKKNNANRRKSRLMKKLNVTLNVGQPSVLKEKKAKPSEEKEEKKVDAEVQVQVEESTETAESEKEETSDDI